MRRGGQKVSASGPNHFSIRSLREPSFFHVGDGAVEFVLEVAVVLAEADSGAVVDGHLGADDGQPFAGLGYLVVGEAGVDQRGVGVAVQDGGDGSSASLYSTMEAPDSDR